MRIVLIILTLFIALQVWGQKPIYVPFQYEGQTGMMKTDGTLIASAGQLTNHPIVIGDFTGYIVGDGQQIGHDYFLSAVSGKKLLSGRMDWDCGELTVGKFRFYHFKKNEQSLMVCAGQDPIPLQRSYPNIEPNQQAWSNEMLQNKHFVWALKEDGTYDVLIPEDNFMAVKELPAFESYDLIFGVETETAPMQLLGFVLGSREAIDRKFGQMYGIPPSDHEVAVYDINFKKLGISAYQEQDLSALFKKEVQVRGTMLPPPQMRNQLIYPSGKVIMLNEEFSLIPDEADSSRLVLVNTQKNNDPVLGNAHFDYRYYSSADNMRALLQIRHRDSGSIFYFDFEGTFFPKGIPMIPHDMMKWKSIP